jgi:hypothetical protein
MRPLDRFFPEALLGPEAAVFQLASPWVSKLLLALKLKSFVMARLLWLV